MNILLIDNDESIASVVKETLEPEFPVTHASTGEEGLKLLKGDYCMALLDLELPDTKGLDLLKRMIATKKNFPIIIITAYRGMASVVEAIKIGAYSCLEKPFKVEDLHLAVKKTLDDCRTRKEITLSAFFEDKLKHLLDGISRMEHFNLYETVLTEVDRSLLTLVLNHTEGNQVQAARILGINRNTLKKKINKLNIPLQFCGRTKRNGVEH